MNESGTNHMEKSHFKIAMEATSHCLVGCGLGDIAGFIIGTAFGLGYFISIFTGIIFGLIFGFGLGLMPLLRSKIMFRHAAKIVIATELASILVMETAETLIEIFFPGMKKAGLLHLTYWAGLGTALTAGFFAAYPVNLFLVKRGVRHQH